MKFTMVESGSTKNYTTKTYIYIIQINLRYSILGPTRLEKKTSGILIMEIDMGYATINKSRVKRSSKWDPIILVFFFKFIFPSDNEKYNLKEANKMK